jgi:hypothetical protein
MRHSSALFLTCIVLALWASHDFLSADEAPAQNQEPAGPTEKVANKATSSEKAVVKDIVYGLEEDENRLYLTSQPLDGVDRQLKRVELKFAVPKNGRIVELSLAKLNGKNLMAVVKVARDNEFDFHCLTFIGPWGASWEGHIRDRFGYHEAKFFTIRDDLKILAVGGKQFQGSVFIVLGDTGLDDKGEAWVTEGAFYFSNCPWPPSDGVLTPFRVTKALDFGGKN